MNNTVEFIGKIIFEPENLTKKQVSQSSWKRVAFVEFEGDICEYYAWFIKRRYNLVLNRPIRKAHISFINDSLNDIGDNISKWEIVKQKYDNKQISVKLLVDVRGNSTHWWLPVPEEYRKELHDIRSELGLGRPYWGLHLSIGYANVKFVEHSRYILRGINNKLIT